MAMKYINREGSIFMFPEHVEHGDFIIKMGISKDEVIGAGFVRTDADGELYPYGRSQSLDIGVGEHCRSNLSRSVI